MGGRGSLSPRRNYSKIYDKLNKIVEREYEKSLDELRQLYRDAVDKTKGGTQKQYKDLIRYAQNQGFDVIQKDLSYIDPELRGRTDIDEKRILIDSKLSLSERIKVLSHEIGHATMHADGKTEDVGQREAEAEAFSKLTTETFGLENNNSSEYYIPGWMKKEGTPVSDFAKYKDKVIKTFSKMMDFLGL